MVASSDGEVEMKGEAEEMLSWKSCLTISNLHQIMSG